ncbi:MAG: hypothetical protein ACOC23_05955 [Thermodesulfobacteriota bacterium]
MASIASLLKEHKTAFIIIGVVLFLLELEIFAIAAMKSGRKSYLQVLDKQGNVIHETDGKSLSDFNKYYFEKTFGPLEDYQKRLEVKEIPFPFRAWFTAAIGIPIGVILLFAFVVKAYVSLFYGDEDKTGPPAGKSKMDHHLGEFEKIVHTVNSFNIFTIGFLILLGVFMYWVLPNMVAYIGRVSVDTLVRFKWVVIAAAAVVVGLFAWIIYLRYLLAKRSIDNQAELERARLELEFNQGAAAPMQLEYQQNGSDAPPDAPPDAPMVAWKEKSEAEAPAPEGNSSAEDAEAPGDEILEEGEVTRSPKQVNEQSA